MASTSSAFEVSELPANSQDSFGTSEDEEELDPPPVKKKRGKNLKYSLLQAFETKKEFDLWWQAEAKSWWFHSRTDGKDENWEMWFCKFNGNKSGRAGVKCEARIRVYFDHSTDAVRVMVCEKEHNHIAEKQVGFPEHLKTMIKQCLAHGMTAKKIHIKLTNESFDPMPTLQQVQFYVDNQRAATSKPFTDAQMREYCDANSEDPVDENSPYVLASSVESTDSFYVLWTTPKLLQRQLQSEQLQVDATYKTNWHEYPVIIVGHSVRFGSGAITAATRTHFPRALRIMCFAHVIRRFDKHSAALSEELRKRLRSDFCMLQYAQDPIEFNRMATSMLENWQAIGDPDVRKFTEYVRKTYLDSELFAFFEGASENCVNNNGLEAVNNGLKRDHTFRKLLSLPVFFEKVSEFLNYWSVHAKDVVTKPTIPLKVYKAAHQLQQQCSGAQQPKRYFIKISGGGAPTYAFSAWNEDTKQSAHQSDLELYAAYRSFAIQGLEDFIHYKKDRFKVYVVRPASNGQYYVCTCPEGSKKEPCKHATMIMCAFAGLYEYPAEVTAQPMKTNRKVKDNLGRRPLAKSQNRHAAGS